MHTQHYPDVPPDFGNWLAGFIDGEGCFYITRNPNGSHCPRFALRLRDDDGAILSEIHTTTGIGRLCSIKAGNHGGRATAHWQAQSGPDCLALIAILDHCPLRSKKARDYVIWREAVTWWTSRRGTRWNPTDWTPMQNFKSHLEQQRSYSVK